MAIKRIDVVERLSGRGIVFVKYGKKLGEANYEIDVLQPIIDVGTKDDPDAEFWGLRDAEGRCTGNTSGRANARCWAAAGDRPYRR